MIIVTPEVKRHAPILRTEGHRSSRRRKAEYTNNITELKPTAINAITEAIKKTDTATTIIKSIESHRGDVDMRIINQSEYFNFFLSLGLSS